VIFPLQVAATVVLLGVLGLPASLWAFRERPLFTRVGAAPALGLAVGSVVLFTAAYVMPMRTAAWAILLPLLVLAAVTGVDWASRRRGLLARLRDPRNHRRSAWTLAAVVAVIATLAVPLALLGSRGPMGYLVNDATGGYPAIMASLQQHALSDPKPWGPGWNVMLHYGSGWAGGFQQGGFEALAAAIASLLSWNVLALQSALLGALIVTGGMAMGALVRAELPGAPVYLPAAACVLYGGPLTMHLFIEGSQAALAGLALVPVALLALTGIRVPMRARPVLALAIVLAGIQTVYPLTYPLFVAGTATVALIVAARSGLSRRTMLRSARSTVAPVALAVAASLVLSPVALSRNLEYWRSVSTGGFLDALAPIFPQYDLGFSAAVPWLVQLRPFPYFRESSGVSLGLVLLSVAAIVVLAVSLLHMLRASRLGVPVAVVAVVVGAAALVAGTNSECNYCTQRSAVVLGPLILLLLLAVVVALAAWTRGPARVAAPLAVLCLIGAAGAASASLTSRVVEDGYALPTAALDAATRLGELRGDVLLEGANGSYHAVHELPALYYAVAMSGQRISYVRGDDYHFGLAFGPSTLPAAEFTPSYRLVLSRFGAVRTGRRTIARYGPFAIQERNRRLDAVIVAGVVADRADRERSGRAWIDGRLVVRVVSPRRTRAHAEVTLRQRGVERVDHSGRLVRLRPGLATVCVDAGRVRGTRDVSLRLLGDGGPVPGPSGFDLRARPSRQVELVRLLAVEGSCAGA
jgi:hypothetical protein